MSLRFHEIAESKHRLHNPLSQEKLMLLAEICQLKKSIRILDLSCGNGELLCQWADKFGIKGTGVEISEAFISAANQRANELGVWSSLQFVHDTVETFPQPFHQYDIVSSLSGPWLGGSIVKMINVMRQALKDEHEGLLLLGDIFWRKSPPDAVCDALGIERDFLSTLGQLSDHFNEAGTELLEMIIANRDDWDRYNARQWMTTSEWLRENPDDPDGPDLRRWMKINRQNYLKYEREYLGWGIFVLRTEKR